MFDKVLNIAKDAVAQGQELANRATVVGKEKLSELQEKMEASEKLEAVEKYVENTLDTTDSEEVATFAKNILLLIKK